MTEEILEKTKTIAVFMGYELFPNNCVRVGTSVSTGVEYWGKYHRDWKWLIPAWSKLYQIKQSATLDSVQLQNWEVFFEFEFLNNINSNDPLQAFRIFYEALQWFNNAKITRIS